MKYALIIGGSSGIGFATARKLASHGFGLVIIHRDRKQQALIFQETINNLRKEHSVQIITKNIDATNAENVKEILNETCKEIDTTFQLVLHSISRGNLKSFFSEEAPTLSQQDLQLTMQSMGTNLQLWVEGLLNHNLLAKNSSLVALTSEGNNRFWPGYGAVAIAKSALETMVKYLAVELASKGITVNSIQAGVTDTPSLRLIPDVDELIEHTKQRNPSGRLTTPEDVANVVYLLSLPESRWINGSLIHVDGGEHLV